MAGHAEAAWPQAFAAVSEATGADADAVLAFLDSSHGRHFADTVVNRMFGGAGLVESIDAAVTTWMGWTIGRVASREYGIPRGMAYLTGFVLQAGISTESI